MEHNNRHHLSSTTDKGIRAVRNFVRWCGTMVAGQRLVEHGGGEIADFSKMTSNSKATVSASIERIPRQPGRYTQ